MQRNRKIIYSSLLASIFLVGIFWFIVVDSKNPAPNVVFLDVGQGDAILISEGSQQILIDGGKDGKLLLEKLGKYIPFWDREIETVIMSHPDQDHIGGFVDVFKPDPHRRSNPSRRRPAGRARCVSAGRWRRRSRARS